MWKEAIKGGFETGALCRHFPWMLLAMKCLPPKLVAAMNPQVGFLMKWQSRAKANVERILSEKSGKPNDETASGANKRTMFHALRDRDLPPSEKSLQRFCDEGEIVLEAGSETTAATLPRIWFYLLDSPAILNFFRN